MASVSGVRTRPGRDCVHTDATRTELQRRHLDQHGEARLGGAVRAHAVGGLDRVQAGGRHDRATRPHAPGGVLHRQEWTDEVDVDHVLPLADVGVDDWSEGPDARVGERDVERSELVLGDPEQRFDVGLIAHVATPSQDARTELPGDCRRGVAVDVADHHACSLGHKASYRGEADTRRAAGDDGVLSCKTSFCHGRRLAAGSSKHIEVSSAAGRTKGEGRARWSTRRGWSLRGEDGRGPGGAGGRAAPPGVGMWPVRLRPQGASSHAGRRDPRARVRWPGGRCRPPGRRLVRGDAGGGTAGGVMWIMPFLPVRRRRALRVGGPLRVGRQPGWVRRAHCSARCLVVRSTCVNRSVARRPGRALRRRSPYRRGRRGSSRGMQSSWWGRERWD